MLTITTPPPAIDSRNENAFVLRISGTAQNVTTAVWLVSEKLPRRWVDYHAGRVVDMERALEDKPPPTV